MKKRGQSNILVTVLLIAVAIVGFLIVFNIAKPLVTEKSNDVGTQFNRFISSLFGSNSQEKTATTYSPSNLITQCQIISTPNSYNYLNQNIVQADYDTCIDIMATNVTLDCKGYSITTSLFGIIGIQSSFYNTIIQNCNISGFKEGWGIWLTSASSSVISNNILTNNTKGIEVGASSNVQIINNKACGNTQDVYCWSSSAQTFTNNWCDTNTGCGGTCIPCQLASCINDTGCSAVGNFCDGNRPYNCTLNLSDGCLDRTNKTICGSGYGCLNGACINQTSSSNLISHYKFDVDARDFLGKNNGTLKNGAYITNDSEKGNALKLDGSNDYVDVNSKLGNFGTSNFTLSFWIKTNSARIEYLISKRVSTICNNFWNFRLEAAGNISFEVNDAANCPGYAMPTSANKINDGLWHHITGKREGKNITIYVDGVLNKSKLSANLINFSNNANFYIGKIIGGNNFKGLIDDVMVFNKSLNSSEILQIYNEQKPNPPIVCYSDEGSCTGGVIEDMDCSEQTNKGDCESIGICNPYNTWYCGSKENANDCIGAQYCTGPGCGTATPPACIGNGGFCQPVSDSDCSPWNTNPTGCNKAYGGNKCMWRGGECWPQSCKWQQCTWNPKICQYGCLNGTCAQPPNVTISLATLKDNYAVEERIDLTDPPEGVI